MPHPAEIHDPQFEILRVLHNDPQFSVAYGRWERDTSCLGMRWNGAEGRLGYPVGRQRQPKFLVLPESFTGPVLQMLARAALPGTDLAAVKATLVEGEPPTALPAQDPGLGSHPDADHLLRVAKWHLAQIEGAAVAMTPAAAALLSDHADVVTVYSAARIEAGLNTFIGSPLLFMNEKGPRRFLAKIMTKYLRLRVPQKIKFLREQVPTLKRNDVLTKAEALCVRRNRILHTSFEYKEVKSLPDQPYVKGLHDHLPPSAFVQRPVLSTHRDFRPPLEQAREDNETAGAFLQLMRGIHPFEPWPPAGFGA